MSVYCDICNNMFHYCDKIFFNTYNNEILCEDCKNITFIESSFNINDYDKNNEEFINKHFK